MSITVTTRIVSVQVRSKKVKERDEDDRVMEYTVPVGRITLEFEAIEDVARIAKLIGDRPVILGLADSQLSLRGLIGDVT